MSGGVDSSVTALLLAEAGHEVIGVFLRNGISAPHGGAHKGCCSSRDACDAQEVAGLLGIPFYAIDHAQPFQRIVDAFVADYAEGRTPNPCVQCNREIKFGELHRFAASMGASHVATGHYARLAADDHEVRLLRGRDHAKDQSYVLATVEREALRRSLFPCGELHKDEVRERAERAGLPVFAKPESQEICFVPSGDYRDLLRERRPELFSPGRIVDGDGNRLGEHEGYPAFTIGQRRGLQLGGGGPWFVTAIEPERNEVRVGRRGDAATPTGTLGEVNWIAPPRSADAFSGLIYSGLIQVRAHHEAVPAVARAIGGDRLRVELTAGSEVLTPGQIGVLYEGDRVLAAGRFERAEKEIP
jgi:tRNA-specific 2-thiouridylase